MHLKQEGSDHNGMRYTLSLSKPELLTVKESLRIAAEKIVDDITARHTDQEMTAEQVLEEDAFLYTILGQTKVLEWQITDETREVVW
jgi:hypothetical protein